MFRAFSRLVVSAATKTTTVRRNPATTSLFFQPQRLIEMHQTKIGQFFKKSTVAGDSPAAVEVSTKKSNNLEVNGRKRKSKVSSEEEGGDSEEDIDMRKAKKNCLKVKLSLAKKPRSRIVVASSSEEEEPEPEPIKEPEEVTTKSKKKVKTPPKKKETKKRESTKKEQKVFTSSDEEEEVESKKKSTSKKESPKVTAKKESNVSSGSEEEEEPVKSKTSPSTKSKKKSTPPKKATKKEESKKKKAAVSSDDDEEEEEESKSKKESKSKTNGTTKKEVKEEDVEEPEKKKVSSTKDETKSKEEVKSKSPEKSKKEESPVKNGGFTKVMMGGGANPKGWNADYDPSKAKYHPIDDATWNRGEKVPYLALAKTLEVIESTSSRLKFIEILANYFRSVIVLSPGDLLFSVYLCLNKLAPAYEGIELGVAETNVMKAIAQATGRALDKIKTDAGQLGDLGLVAERSRSNQKTLFQPEPLTVSGVFHKLKEIAAMTGQASHSKKISMITSMLVACKYSEARYLTRSLLGKLRIGLAEQSLLQALAQATYLTPPDQDMSVWPPKVLNAGAKMSADSLKTAIEEHAFIVKSCFCECPNYDILIKALLEVGIGGLEERCRLTPGIPPRPMLAQPTKGVADVLQRFEGIRFTCEYKYDGERAQIHMSDDGAINIYSRNQENNTSKYPDIISRFSSCVKAEVKSCIIDTEAVAYDLEKGGILPFQVLSTRKRKDANEAEIKVQVCIFAFDLIYLNGKSLVKEPLFKRRELLREHFQVVEKQFLFATSIDTDSMEEVQEFLEESIKGNCEGLMVKTLDERASYELAKRSQKWLKLKKDYLESGGDSLDLVVIGGFLGKGKRTGTYGGFLLACYDPEEEAFQTICKIGTGFSDEQLQQHSENLKPNIIPHAKSYYRFNPQLTPDHWFDAVQVWEVKCADLSLSPVHKAGEGIVDAERGISLRFPRFLRVREDKNVEDATSSRQVADMYRNQEQVKNSTDRNGQADDDEFY